MLTFQDEKVLIIENPILLLHNTTTNMKANYSSETIQ